MAQGRSGFHVGDTLAGYRIEAVLGRGGMGTVYLATHLRLERKAALKVLIPELGNDDNFRARFVRESRMVAALDHPSVVPIYDADEHDGTLFIAMRYVEGGDLKAHLKERMRLSTDRALEVIEQVAGALDAAHAARLVHRDVKPANILLEKKTGRAYLTDFGVAKSSTATGLTRTGSFLGTVDYCAPEQISGKPIDGLVDVYALGCVLYHCLTGQPPYVRETEVAVVQAHLTDPIPALTTVRPDLPRALDGVIVTAMAKHPEVRFATAGALADALRAALAEGEAATKDEPSVTAQPTPPPPPVTVADVSHPIQMSAPVRPPEPAAQTTRLMRGHHKRRRGLILGGAITVAILVAAVGAAVLLGGSKTKSNARSTDSAGTSTEATTNDQIANIVARLESPHQNVSADLAALSSDSRSSFAQLNREKTLLKDRIFVAEGSTAGLSSTGPSERRATPALTIFLSADDDYARALTTLSNRRSVTGPMAAQTQSKAAFARGAFSALLAATGNPCCPRLTFGGTDHLTALVRREPPRRRIVPLTPLLQGFGPDDPPDQGRCFGPYTSRAVVTVNGTDYHSNFIQCGDYGGGAPWRASGTYTFNRDAVPASGRLVSFSGLAAVDANSSSGQVGTTVTWTVYYYGTAVCTVSLIWEGTATPGRPVNCALSQTQPADTSQLSIVQDVTLAGSGSFWAGFVGPRVTFASG
jgi:serine/threonine-protein kinase